MLPTDENREIRSSHDDEKGSVISRLKRKEGNDERDETPLSFFPAELRATLKPHASFVCNSLKVLMLHACISPPGNMAAHNSKLWFLFPFSSKTRRNRPFLARERKPTRRKMKFLTNCSLGEKTGGSYACLISRRLTLN